jgi:hypothetical protein
MLSERTASFSFSCSAAVHHLQDVSLAISEVKSEHATVSKDPVSSKSSFIFLFQNVTKGLLHSFVLPRMLHHPATQADGPKATVITKI